MIVDNGIVMIVVRQCVEPWANGWKGLGKCVNEMEVSPIVVEVARILVEEGPVEGPVRIEADHNAAVLADAKRFQMTSCLWKATAYAVVFLFYNSAFDSIGH